MISSHTGMPGEGQVPCAVDIIVVAIGAEIFADGQVEGFAVDREGRWKLVPIVKAGSSTQGVGTGRTSMALLVSIQVQVLARITGKVCRRSKGFMKWRVKGGHLIVM